MAYSLEERPRLRWPLDVQQWQDNDGHRFIVLRDTLGIAEQPAVIPVELGAIVSRLDGQTSLQQILDLAAPYGLTAELLLFLVGSLEEMHFIDNGTTQERWQNLVAEFEQSPLRPAAHAGKVYPAEPDKLAAAIKHYLSQAGNTLNGDSLADAVALISPHIDYQRGWRTYAASYSALERIPKPDVIFLLGTAHQGGRGMFHLTDKSFSNPLGTFETAREVVANIAAAVGRERCFGEQFLHRQEHSLELQLPFLSYRYQGDALPQIVPILVGSFHHYFERGISPIEDGEVADFVGAMAVEIKDLEASGKKVLLYGGVDLAHVGTHFGDQARVSDDGLSHLEARDRALLTAILSGDEQQLYEHMAEDCDQRRICGYPSIYTMLAALRLAGHRLRGQCLEYRQAVEPASDCVVTFAGAFWEKY